MWKRALQEEFNFCFKKIFTTTDKIFISVLEGGLSIRQYYYEVLRFS